MPANPEPATATNGRLSQMMGKPGLARGTNRNQDELCGCRLMEDARMRKQIMVDNFIA